MVQIRSWPSPTCLSRQERQNCPTKTKWLRMNGSCWWFPIPSLKHYIPMIQLDWFGFKSISTIATGKFKVNVTNTDVKCAIIGKWSQHSTKQTVQKIINLNETMTRQII
jgi:hypothetical protein